MRDAAAEDGRVPGIDMAVEVDDAYLAPMVEGRSQCREGCGVIASQCDNARDRVVGVVRPSTRNPPVATCELRQSDSVVEESQRRIAAVHYLRPICEYILARVDAVGHVRCDPS